MFILFSILTNAALVLILKAFEKFKVGLFQALVFNYITAALFGFIFGADDVSFNSIIHSEWIGMSALLGMFFISLFYLIGLSSQQAGVAATSVANKMSLAIPVLIAFFAYNEKISALKILGIVLAMLAVYFASKKESTSQKSRSKFAYLLPFIIFFGSGILDALINYSQKSFDLSTHLPLFLSCSFGSAAVLGSIALSYLIFIKKEALLIRSVIGGLILGLVNYFSIYFFVLALSKSGLESTVVFPINNMGVVVFSALLAFWIYKERLSKINLIGVVLSLIAIVLIVWNTN